MTSQEQHRRDVEHALAAARRARHGQGACEGCRKVVDLAVSFVVAWKRAVVLVLCEGCLVDYDVVASRTPEGIDVRISQRAAILVSRDTAVTAAAIRDGAA